MFSYRNYFDSEAILRRKEWGKNDTSGVRKAQHSPLLVPIQSCTVLHVPSAQANLPACPKLRLEQGGGRGVGGSPHL